MNVERIESPPSPPPLKKRGRKRAPLPRRAPLDALKMVEVLAYLGEPSDREFGLRIGSTPDEVWKWHRGRKPLTKKDKLVMAHTYGIPVDWWDQPGVPVGAVLQHAPRRRRDDYILPPVVPLITPQELVPKEGGKDGLSPTAVTAPDLHGFMENWEKKLEAKLDTKNKHLRKLVRADVREMCGEVQEMIQQILARK